MKSGWASAVVLTAGASFPDVVDSGRIELSDPAIPESRQPYHAGFGTARTPGPELSDLIALVERVGHRSVADFVERQRAAGLQCSAAAIVVGSLIDPAGIGNDHIRIHALEGQLFRRVLQEGVVRSGLPWAIWRERDLYDAAARGLSQPQEHLRKALTALGRAVSGPWRAEQKAAALAAWLVLSGSRTAKPTSDKRKLSGRRGK